MPHSPQLKLRQAGRPAATSKPRPVRLREPLQERGDVESTRRFLRWLLGLALLGAVFWTLVAVAVYAAVAA